MDGNTSSHETETSGISWAGLEIIQPWAGHTARKTSDTRGKSYGIHFFGLHQVCADRLCWFTGCAGCAWAVDVIQAMNGGIEMKVLSFRDIETGETITTEQLYSEYLQNMKSGEYEAVTFSEYVYNCLTANNGTLEVLETEA